MDNNNKRSPLEEIKRLTGEAKSSAPRRSAAQPQARRVEQQPVGRPTAPRPVQRPASQPRTAAPTRPAASKPTGSRPNRIAAEDNQMTRKVDIPKIEPKPTRTQKVEEYFFDNIEEPKTSSKEQVKSPRPTKAPKKKGVRPAESNMDVEFEETVGKGMLSGTIKAVIYIVSVLIVSVCLALAIIFVGNDCFAFVKSTDEAVITVPENPDIDKLADLLAENKIIEYPSMFKLYLRFRHKIPDEYVPGDHKVNPMMSYDKLIEEFTPSATRKEVTITIVEGLSTQEIIDLFISNGIGTQEGFNKAINETDYDFWFLQEIDQSKLSQRVYKLDGYLFPDTYNFFTDSSEEDVIYKLLLNFDAKLDETYKQKAQQLGYTIDDIVTLASVVQKEAKYVSDYPLVSSVFHNRLNSNVTNGQLQSNATVQYTMPKDEVSLDLSQAQIDYYDNAYNTFKYRGLPVGPICNPSINAIYWSLYPNDTDYYYFVSDADGYNLYATTYNQHLRNVASVSN